MLGSIYKKFVKKDKETSDSGTKIAQKLRENSAKFSEFLSEKFAAAQDEFETIKDKCGNLQETNYRLGLKHLEKGNLAEAIFRFRLIKKFWPQCFDAYYYLAYTLVLKKNPQAAIEVLNELLNKNPSYNNKARELLGYLNKSIN